MKQNKETRFKTLTLNQVQTPPARKFKSGNSNPHKLEKVNNSEREKYDMICKTTSKDFPGSPTSLFCNRESGRVNLLPYKNKETQKSHLEAFKTQVKAQLQKLSLREKILQIESVLRNTRELCKSYGYFSVTFAMLKFHFNQEIKISVWIHPDPRSTKPLHPIRKQTNFQCELACVSELKSILKSLIPNVDLGDGKTFGTVIAHLDNTKSQIDMKQRKNTATQKDLLKTNPSPKNRSDKLKSGLAASSKTIPTFCCLKQEDDTADQLNRKPYKIDLKHKETASTLVQSIRSANSIREKLKLQSPLQPKNKQDKLKPDIKKAKKEKERKPSFSQPPKDNMVEEEKDEDSNRVSQAKLNQQDKLSGRQTQPHMYNSQNKSGLKTSNIRRFMTMSIEIESEINNLFENDDMRVSNFYSGGKNFKNTELTKVAEQFEDLF